MSLDEAILEKVRDLSPSQKEEVLRFAEKVHDRPTAKSVPFNYRHEELDWIERNREAYLNMWVALEATA
jgi:hypothetical protein